MKGYDKYQRLLPLIRRGFTFSQACNLLKIDRGSRHIDKRLYRELLYEKAIRMGGYSCLMKYLPTLAIPDKQPTRLCIDTTHIPAEYHSDLFAEGLADIF